RHVRYVDGGSGRPVDGPGSHPSHPPSSRSPNSPLGPLTSSGEISVSAGGGIESIEGQSTGTVTLGTLQHTEDDETSNSVADDSDFECLIDWGDGTSEDATLVPIGGASGGY